MKVLFDFASNVKLKNKLLRIHSYQTGCLATYFLKKSNTKKVCAS